MIYEGPEDAKIIFVQATPTYKAALLGVGMEGYVLARFEQLLSRAGLNRHHVGVLTISTRAISDGEIRKRLRISGGRPLFDERMLVMRDALKQRLAQSSANVFVPMDECSFRMLQNETKVGKHFASILPCWLVPGRKVIPSHHPKDMNAQYELHVFIAHAFKRARDEQNSREIMDFERRPIIEPSFSHVMDYIDAAYSAEELSIDIETAGNQITAIGFGWKEDEAICIPMTNIDGSPYWPEKQDLCITRALDKLLRSDIPKGGQNFFYDATWFLINYHMPVHNVAWDTMVAQHCCYSELPKDLGTLTALYTRHPYYKDEGLALTSQKLSKLPVKERLRRYWTYNCLDVMTTLEVWHALQKEMDDLKVRRVHDMIMQKFWPCALYMTAKGIRYDVEAQERLKAAMSEELAKLEKSPALLGVNPNSSKQIMDKLYGDLGVPTQIHLKSGQATAEAKALERIAKKYKRARDFCTTILEYRKTKKLVSTYLNMTPYALDGRVHTNFNVVGTFARWSSSASSFGDSTNLQNIPRDLIRDLYIPDEEMLFINADLSQAEARIVAMLAGCRALLELFDSGKDVHTENACRIFGIAPEDAKKPCFGTLTYRDMGKRIVHASNYALGPRTFAQLCEIPQSKARELLDAYFDVYPEIRAWHRKIDDQVKRTRCLITPFGRKRIFFGRLDVHTLKSAYSYIPQATVADILNLGLHKLFINYPWIEPILQVHDSVLAQAPASRIEEARDAMVECLIMPIEINGYTHTIPVDSGIGETWAKAK